MARGEEKHEDWILIIERLGSLSKISHFFFVLLTGQKLLRLLLLFVIYYLFINSSIGAATGANRDDRKNNLYDSPLCNTSHIYSLDHICTIFITNLLSISSQTMFCLYQKTKKKTPLFEIYVCGLLRDNHSSSSLTDLLNKKYTVKGNYGNSKKGKLL